jgi:non-heme chloroperoxidase
MISRAMAALFSRVLENDDVLARIRVPTLVIHGSDYRIVRVRASEHNAHIMPGARLLIYEGAGHTPYLEQPDRFNRDLDRNGLRLSESRSGQR